MEKSLRVFPKPKAGKVLFRFLSLFFLLTSLLGSFTTAKAQLLLYEGFDYTSPSYIGGNGDAGTSSNNWFTHSVTAGQTTTVDLVDASLTYSGLATSVGKKVLLFSGGSVTSRDVNRALSTTSTVLYYSLLINVVDNSQLTTTGEYFVHFGAASGNSSGSQGGRVNIKSSNGGANFRVSVVNNSGTGSTYSEYATDLNFGTTYFLVVKYDFTGSSTSVKTTANLWVNPTSLGGLEPTADLINATGANTFIPTVGINPSICLRNATATPKIHIDEIRVGLTYADVTPVPSVTCAAPTTQADAISFSAKTKDQVSVDFSATNGIGNGDGIILVAKEGSAVTYTPSDGSYASGINQNFATATDQGSGNKVIYKGNAKNITITGLNANTTYHFAAFAYNDCSASPKFNTTSPSVSNTTTLACLAPTTQADAITFSGTTKEQTTVNLNGIGNGDGYILVAKEASATNWTPSDNAYALGIDLNFTTATDQGSGNKVVYKGTSKNVTVTGLTANTTYHFTAFAYNDCSTQPKYNTTAPATANTNTLDYAAPTVQVGALTLSGETTAKMDVSLASGGDGDRVIIIAKNAAFTGAVPDNNTTYSASTDFTSGASSLIDGGKVVYVGTYAGIPNPLSITNLTPETTYYFEAFAYNDWSGFTRYLTTNPATASKATLAPLAPVITLTGTLSDFSNVAGTASVSQNYKVSAVNLTSDVVIGPLAGFEFSKDNTTFTASVTLAFGTGTISDVTVYVRVAASTVVGVYAGNIAHTSTKANTQNVAANATVLAVEPTAARTVSFELINGSSMKILFASVENSGTSRVVVVREGAAATWAAADGTGTANVNTDFTVAGDQGNGNKIVLDGTASDVTVTGLVAFKTYHVAVYEYNWDGTNAKTRNYFATAGVGSKMLTVPTLTTTSALFNFIGILPDASVAQMFKVKGDYLKGNVTISANIPNFEFSTDGSVYSGTLTLNQTGGIIAETTVYVRVTAASDPGIFTGKIMLATEGTDAQNISISATVVGKEPAAPRAVSFSAIGPNTMKISLSNVATAGTSRVVYVKEGSVVNWMPTDSEGITGVNANISLAADQGYGNKAVYDGIGFDVTITGLSPMKTYHVAVYEYNWDNANIKTRNYLMTAGTGSQSTSGYVVPYTCDFNAADITAFGFTQYSVSGDQIWTIDPKFGVNSTGCAKMTGFVGGNFVNEDWLISPPINLDLSQGEKLNFMNARGMYDVNVPITAWYSTNYTGGNPTAATWTQLTGFTQCSAKFVWTPSGSIDISNINGTNVYFAFKYTSSATASETWEIDDFSVTAATLPTVTLASAAPAVAVGNIRQTVNDQVIYKFSLASANSDATLTGLSFTTNGDYAATDISKIKVKYSTDSKLDAADVELFTKDAPGVAGTITTTALSQVIPFGGTGYIFITVDLPANATVGKTIGVNALTTDNVTLAAGTKTGTATAGGVQTIIAANNNTSTIVSAGNEVANIDYAAYTSATISNVSLGLKVWSFTIKDGGDIADADAVGTIPTSIEINKGAGNTVASWASTIKRAALYNGTTKVADLDVTAEKITFSGLTAANVQTADNAVTTLDLYLTFETANITDNQQLQFQIANTSVTASYDGSTFGPFAPATSSVTTDNNKIEVKTSTVRFKSDPTTTALGVNMTPAIDVEAIDANLNVDKDQTGAVTITSTGTLSSAVSASMVAGFVSFANIVHNVEGTGFNLKATLDGFATVTNATLFDIKSELTLTGTVYDFKNVYLTHFSTRQWFTVKAFGLTADAIVTAPTGFEVSLQCNDAYSASVTIPKVGGNIAPVKVYVRFKPTATGAANGFVFVKSGSLTRFVPVSGNGIADDSYIPANYYSTATGSAATLKDGLFNIIKTHTTLTYTPGLWDAYYTTDVKFNGKVADIYTDKVCDDPSFEFTLGVNQQGSGGTGAEGVYYNREHSFVKSYFGGEAGIPMYTDLMHIYPTDSYVNTKRTDNPYGEVASPTWVSTSNGSKIGPCSFPGYTGTVFEPIDEYKGDLARTYFYMATCYQDKIASWQKITSSGDAILDGSSFRAFEPWFLALLVKWHQQDPVSQKEIERNQAAYKIQGNRNPFIDHPEYVNSIFVVNQTITFGALTDKLTSDAPFALTATASSGLPVTYYSSNTGVATISGSTVTIKGPGTTVITASQAGNGTYNPAIDVKQTLKVALVAGYENTLENNVKVYPNPAKDIFYVEFENLQEQNELSIINIVGKTVMTKTLNQVRTPIDVSSLSKGIYFVRIQNGKDIKVEKLIVE